MGTPSLKKPEGPIVWSSTDPDQSVFVSQERWAGDNFVTYYYVWVRDPKMIPYGYSTGYAHSFSNTSKRGAIKRARLELERINPHASTARHHATKKSPAQLQREIDEALSYYVMIGEGPKAHAREHRFDKLASARAFALDASKAFPRRRAMVYRDEGGFDELLGHYEHGKRLA